jgi:hypothetical protein
MPANDRAYTFLFPTASDKARWKKFAEPLCLNKWIFLMVERALETASTPPPDDNVGDFSITGLQTEVRMLRHQKKDLEETIANAEPNPQPPEPLNKDVVSLLRSGGSWTSTHIIKELGSDHLSSINYTLEQLLELELIKRDWRGFSWIK